MSSEARKVYDEAIVIDGLNVSNWESDAVFEHLRAGNITAIEMSEQPVAITHGNARSFCDHPRNKEEEALKLLAEKGASWALRPSKGIDSPAEFPNLAEALANRGYKAEAIAKLLGGNWMSLFERVWNV